MNASERRTSILETIRTENTAVSASRLAKRFGVSRQIIVGDIALLRASGYEITSTPRGYCLPPSVEPVGIRRRIVCRHSEDQILDEFYAVVDNGGTVQDVIIDHPLYGELIGSLQISSRADAEAFVQNCRESSAPPLSLLTDGVHSHTIVCPDSVSFDRIAKALSHLGISIS